jgi:predicted protein tyrosine phosphatase
VLAIATILLLDNRAEAVELFLHFADSLAQQAQLTMTPKEHCRRGICRQTHEAGLIQVGWSAVDVTCWFD